METSTPRSIRPEDSLQVIRTEYLEGFVRLGGAAVKVVVAKEQEDRDRFLLGLHALAKEGGFVSASVNAVTTKVHLIDRLFHAIAAQIPWKELANDFVRRLLAQERYRLPGEGEPLTLAQLARLNERDPNVLANDTKQLLEKALLRDFRMCQEYRYAALELCSEALGQGRVETGAVEEWLRGELRLISSLKGCSISQKVVRHNARHMLLSLAHWVRLAGKPGLVLVIDVGRYLIDKRPKEPDGNCYYSRPATLEAYEVLRELIDGTDDTEGCFVVAHAPADFLSNERRGLGAYEALRFRVEDEVWDHRRPNPLATLVRLSSEAEALGLAAERSQA